MATCTFISTDVILLKLNRADTPECNDRYTVKLFDLASGKWTKYGVDDRLSTLDGGSQPRFGKASADFEVRME